MQSGRTALRNIRSKPLNLVRCAALGRASRLKPALHAGATTERMTCSFGARRVGTMFDRLRLHLSTDRFLAGVRRDPVWEAACDDAVETLGHLDAQLSATRLAEVLPRIVSTAQPYVASILKPACVRRRARVTSSDGVAETTSLIARVTSLRAALSLRHLRRSRSKQRVDGGARR